MWHHLQVGESSALNVTRQRRPHRLTGLDRHDLAHPPGERDREPPGAGADVDHHVLGLGQRANTSRTRASSARSRSALKLSTLGGA